MDQNPSCRSHATRPRCGSSGRSTGGSSAAEFAKRTSLGIRNEINDNVATCRVSATNSGGLAKQKPSPLERGRLARRFRAQSRRAPALRSRVLAKQSHRREAIGPGRDFGKTISGENAKEISDLISAGV